jgi:Phosphotransferase enzyme family
VTRLNAVPARIADITPSFLATALDEPIPASTSITVEQIGMAYGFASTIVRCRWLDGPRTVSVIVKLWDARGVGGSMEPAFYRTFGGRLGIRVPACHLGMIDRQGRGVLVLEDLGRVTQGDALESLEIDPATALALTLADLHATWWAHPDLASCDWLPSFAAIARDPDWFDDRRQRFLERYGDLVGEPERDALANARQLAIRADAVLDGAPSTLLHADLHLDNVVFDGTSPILVDWASAAKGPAEVDLSELTFGIVGEDDRRSVVDAYLARIEQHGIRLDRNVVEARLSAGAIRHFLRSTIGSAVWLPGSEREERLIRVGISRGSAALAWAAFARPALLTG